MIDRTAQPDRPDDPSTEPNEEAPDTDAAHAAGRRSGDETTMPTDGGSPQPSRDLLDLSGDRNASSQRDAGGDERPSAGSEGDEKKQQDDNPPKPPPLWVGLVAVALVLAAVAWGGFTHWRSYQASKQTSNDAVNRPIEVRTAEVKRLDGPVELTLPGETQAFDTANIYPRATGYITLRRVDIGTRVKAGDLLVHISSPDLDQQLSQAEAQIGQTRAALTQAKAQVAQAEANLNLAKVNFARSNQLAQQGYDTQQNRDQQNANQQTQAANVESANAGVRVAEANINAQQANIDRLKALTAFEDVRAPFDGIVTARNVDLGELVNADSNSGAPMFTVVRDAVIRVIVRVPQSSAEGIRDGLDAKVIIPQTPNRPFTGRVQRSSVALLYSSRTLTTEVDVPNETGALRPGLYVSVTFAVPRVQTEVSVPAEALMFDQHGLRVATVENDIVKLNQINVYRDHGATIDLREGLKGGERIVLNPAATLKDGARVKEIREEDEKKKDEEDKANNAQASKGGATGGDAQNGSGKVAEKAGK